MQGYSLTCKLLPQGPGKGSAHHLHTHHNDLGQVLGLWAKGTPWRYGDDLRANFSKLPWVALNSLACTEVDLKGYRG